MAEEVARTPYNVKLLRNLFETTNTIENPIKRNFVRSVSSISLKKPSSISESNNNKRGSVKRSPAFRLEKNYKPSLKSSTEKILHANEQEYSELSSSLTNILNMPLPATPAPPKPPRTFNSPLRDVCVIQEFEKAEHIYSEPFHQNFSFKRSVSPELHYMVSDISTEQEKLPNQCLKSKSTSAIQGKEDQKYEKINLLLDAVFDKESVEVDTLEDQNIKLNNSITDRRKKYALQVSLSFKHEKQQYGLLNMTEHSPVSIAERIKYYKKFIDQNGNEKTNPEDTYQEKLFISCILIGMNLSENKPYVKSAFPKVESLPFIEHFVYPSHSAAKTDDKRDQNHCIILTNDHGIRLYGYCRRVIPENSTVALPLTYCIITNNNSSGFYFKILQEIESRHGQSESQMNFLLTSLHSHPIPQNGRLLHLKLPSEPVRSNISIQSQPPRLLAKRLNLDNNPNWLKDSIKYQSDMKFSKAGFSNNDEIFIKRPSDLRLENEEIGVLYKNTTNKILVKIFGSLLIERKIVLLSTSISKLSSCIFALESILYPLKWQHTIITVVPKDLLEITEAPTPVLVGILKQNDYMQPQNGPNFEEGLIVDLDLKIIVKSCGDESTLLPESLKKSLILSLEMVDLLLVDWPLSNVLIAEAFLRFFVELFADLNALIYQKDAFLKTTNDRSTQFFLEWFLETSIFHQFLKQKLQHDQLKIRNINATTSDSFYALFNEKILEKSKNKTCFEHHKKIEVLIKNCKLMNRKTRTFKEKIKDFFNSD